MSPAHKLAQSAVLGAVAAMPVVWIVWMVSDNPPSPQTTILGSAMAGLGGVWVAVKARRLRARGRRQGRG